MGVRFKRGNSVDYNPAELLEAEGAYPQYADGTHKLWLGNGDGTANEVAMQTALDAINSRINSLYAAGAANIIGSILPYGGTVLPSGCLWADGSAVSRTTYAELFAVYGTTYGAGDGSTTFNVIDMRGRGVMGFNANDSNFNVLGKTGGSVSQKFGLSSGAAAVGAEGDTLRVSRNSQSFLSDVRANLAWTGVSEAEGFSANLLGTTDSGSILDPYTTTNWIIIAQKPDYDDAIATHNADSNAHGNISNKISDAVTTHNSASNVHSAIRGTANGVATLNSKSTLTASQIPQALLNVKAAISKAKTNHSAIFSTGSGEDGTTLNILDNVPADLSFNGESVKNDIANGNFATSSNNLATGFLVSGATAVSCISGEQVFIATAQNGNFKYSASPAAGHRYFVTAQIKSTEKTVQLSVQQDTNSWSSVSHPGDGQYHTLYLIVNIAGSFSSGVLDITDSAVSGWGNISVKNFMAIDMGTDASNPLYSLTADQMFNMINGYIDGTQSISNLLIKSIGKNLFNPSAGTVTGNGVTCTVASDGTITLNGTATAGVWFQLLPTLKVGLTANSNPVMKFVNGSKYTLNHTVLSGSKSGGMKYDVFDSTGIAYPSNYLVDIQDYGAPHTFTAGSNGTLSNSLSAGMFYLIISSGAVFNNYKFRIQIEQNSVATSWDQYKESVFTISDTFSASDTFQFVNGQAYKNGIPITPTGDFIVYKGGQIGLYNSKVLPITTVTYLSDILDMISKL